MKVIVNGSGGHMGRALIDALLKKGYELFAAVDKYDERAEYHALSEVPRGADVLIDFSHHSAALEIAEFARTQGVAVVVATTGHTEEEMEALKDASKFAPVFHSANMSLGVALLVELAKKTAALFPEADIEIVEAHHNRKLDAPSGTAKMILEGILSVLPHKKGIFGRSGMAKREENEIGVHAIRMGNVVGIHEVHVCTENQCITLKHEAVNRALFADGALSAAEYLVAMAPGFYGMNDLLKGKI
ncbi:MAG: 4-hydroxy-tetrahydrodipicolinate reductase [Clostridia bacterium]|nr:4-hydroxy-tetrahydrodipicolinate reductase [Clostridia bacterium]